MLNKAQGKKELVYACVTANLPGSLNSFDSILRELVRKSVVMRDGERYSKGNPHVAVYGMGTFVGGIAHNLEEEFPSRLESADVTDLPVATPTKSVSPEVVKTLEAEESLPQATESQAEPKSESAVDLLYERIQDAAFAFREAFLALEEEEQQIEQLIVQHEALKATAKSNLAKGLQNVVAALEGTRASVLLQREQMQKRLEEVILLLEQDCSV